MNFHLEFKLSHLSAPIAGPRCTARKTRKSIEGIEIPRRNNQDINQKTVKLLKKRANIRKNQNVLEAVAALILATPLKTANHHRRARMILLKIALPPKNVKNEKTKSPS